MNEQLVKEYLDVFSEANPGHPLPEISFNGGWYRLKNGKRNLGETDLMQMYEVLKNRNARRRPQAQKISRASYAMQS